MKLYCNKCSKQLTKDLRPAKGHKYDVEISYDIDDGVRQIASTYYSVKPGIFWTTKARKEYWNENKINDYSYLDGFIKTFHHPAFIVTGKESLLSGIIPGFVEGNGCCNWSMGEELKCKCGYSLGEMYLDCYETGAVQFYENNVRRGYK